MMNCVKRFVILIAALLFLSGCDSETSKTLTIEFDTNGGSPVEQVDINLSDSQVLIPQTVRDRYTFDGWYLEDDFESSFDITTFDTTQTITVYAKFVYDMLEDGPFDSQYETPTETTESYEHILVVEKYFDVDGITDIILLFDFKSLMITTLDIDANIGDIISFDATIEPMPIPVITDVQNIVVESSNNPVYKEIFTGDIPSGAEAYNYRPFFMIYEGYYRGQDAEDANSIYGIDFKSGYEVTIIGDFTGLTAESGALRYGVLVIPTMSDENVEMLNIYDESIHPYEELNLSDTEMVAQIKTYFIKQGTLYSLTFGRSLLNRYPEEFYDATISVTIEPEYSEYYNSETSKMLYSDIDISLPFTVSVTRGSVTESFEVEVVLEGLQTYTMIELFDSSDFEYFIADVIYNNGSTAILYDGESMIDFYSPNNPIDLEVGHSYIFDGLSFFFRDDGYGLSYLDGTAQMDLGESNNSYPVESPSWDELEDLHNIGAFAVNLRGTLSIVELTESLDVYILSDGTTTIIVDLFVDETDDLYSYVDSEIELELIIYGVNDSMYLDNIETSALYSIMMDITEVDETSEILTIDFDTDGGTTIDQLVVDLSDSQTSIPIPVKEGYTFDGWYLDEELVTEFDIIEFDTTQTITVYASWTEIVEVEIEIIFNALGATFDTKTILSLSTVVFPDAPLVNGYEFIGWYFEDTLDTKAELTQIFNQDTILYAKFAYVILEYGPFDSQYETPTETTESYEHILVMDKYLAFDGSMDVTILYDFKSIMITVMDIDANIGDIISFDAIIETMLIPVIVDAQNIVLESSNNPIYKEIFAGDITAGIEAYNLRPFFMIFEGYYSAYEEQENNIYGVDFKSGYKITVSGDLEDITTTSGVARYGVFVLPAIDDEELDLVNIYDESIYPFEEINISDADMVEQIKTYFIQQSTLFSLDFNSSLSYRYPEEFFDADVTLTVNPEYDEYYNSETMHILYSETDILIPFTVTVTVGTAIETFPINIQLNGLQTYTITETMTMNTYEYFVADVLYVNGNSVILYDGEIMISYRDFMSSLDVGHSYVFSAKLSCFEESGGFIELLSANMIADLGETTISYPIETFSWDELEEGTDTNAYVVTLRGTFSIVELEVSLTSPTFSFYCLSDGFIKICFSIFHDETDDLYSYTDTEGEWTIVIHGSGPLYEDGLEINVLQGAILELTEVEDTTDIAFVTDGIGVDNASFNQGTWEGIVEFAETNDITHQYYIPTEISDVAYLEAIALAVADGAEIIVTTGFRFETSICVAQELYPEVYFILVDGVPRTADYLTCSTVDNTLSILFDEHESGFLAGYAAVMDGNTSLGFTGGMPVPAVVKYGIGFIAGAYYAADQLDVTLDFSDDTYHYFGGFSPSEDYKILAGGWYFLLGTEVIFSAAGPAGYSVMEAAEQFEEIEELEAMMIGVDIDQSGESLTVLTSAMKLYENAVEQGLQSWLDDEFVGGTTIYLGAADNGIGLPMDTSRFTSFSQTEYDAIYALLIDGIIVVPSTYNELLLFLNDDTLNIPSQSIVEGN